MAKKQKKVVTLSLDAEIVDRLEAFCEKERRTKSSAIELAVERYLKEEDFDKEAVTNG